MCGRAWRSPTRHLVLDHGVMAWSGTAAALAADEEADAVGSAGASAEEWRFEDALTAEETVGVEAHQTVGVG